MGYAPTGYRVVCLHDTASSRMTRVHVMVHDDASVHDRLPENLEGREKPAACRHINTGDYYAH